MFPSKHIGVFLIGSWVDHCLLEVLRQKAQWMKFASFPSAPTAQISTQPLQFCRQTLWTPSDTNTHWHPFWAEACLHLHIFAHQPVAAHIKVHLCFYKTVWKGGDKHTYYPLAPFLLASSLSTHWLLSRILTDCPTTTTIIYYTNNIIVGCYSQLWPFSCSP